MSNKRVKYLFENAKKDVISEQEIKLMNEEAQKLHEQLIVETIETLFEYGAAAITAGRVLSAGKGLLKGIGTAGLGATVAGMFGSKALTGGSLSDIMGGKEGQPPSGGSNDALERAKAEKEKQVLNDPETIGADTAASRGAENTQTQASLARAKEAAARIAGRKRPVMDSYIISTTKQIVNILESEFNIAPNKLLVEKIVIILQEKLQK